MEDSMSASLEGINPNQHGRFIIPYKGKILENDVTLAISTGNKKLKVFS